MPRSRFLVTVLVVGLLAAGCGGGDAGDRPGPDVEPAVAASAPAPDDPEPDGPAPDTTAEPAELARVRLGDRFKWCADVQNAWDANIDGLSTVLAAVADYHDATDDLRNAVDELDRAEALERIGALTERADDLIENYTASRSGLAGLRSEVADLVYGAEGTKGVAYTRAREAFDANAASGDLRLVAAVLPNRDHQELERLRALPGPPALQAANGIRAALDADDDNVALLSSPDANIGAFGYNEMRDLIQDTGYYEEVGNAAARIALADLYESPDVTQLGLAYADSVDSQTTIRRAFDAADAAFNTTFAPALQEAFDFYGETFEAPQAARDAAREAAREAARPVFEGAAADIESAGAAHSEAMNAFWDAASDETRAAIREATDNDRAWDLADAARRDLLNHVSLANNERQQQARAAIDAAKAAAAETLFTDAHQAAAETARIARADGLASAVVAEALLAQFELGLIEVRSASLAPSTFVTFTAAAVAVETLIGSSAWAAMQQSLTDACRQ